MADQSPSQSALAAATQPQQAQAVSSGNPMASIMQALSMIQGNGNGGGSGVSQGSPMTSTLADVGTTLLQGAKGLPSALATAKQTRDTSAQDKIAAINQAIAKLQSSQEDDNTTPTVPIPTSLLSVIAAGAGPDSILGDTAGALYNQRIAKRDYDTKTSLDISKLAMQKAGIPEDTAEASVNDAIRQTQLGTQMAQQANMGAYHDQLGQARVDMAGRKNVRRVGPSADSPGMDIYLDQNTGQQFLQPATQGMKPMTQNEAAVQAAKDYDILYPKDEYSGKRTTMPPEGLMAWKQKRIAAYVRGDQSAIQAMDSGATGGGGQQPAPNSINMPPRAAANPGPQNAATDWESQVKQVAAAPKGAALKQRKSNPGFVYWQDSKGQWFKAKQ